MTTRKNILMLLHVILLVLAVLVLNRQDKTQVREGEEPPRFSSTMTLQVSGGKLRPCCLQKGVRMREGKEATLLRFISGEPLLRKRPVCQKAIAFRRAEFS